MNQDGELGIHYQYNYAIIISKTSIQKREIAKHDKAVRVQSDQVLPWLPRRSIEDHDDYGR